MRQSPRASRTSLLDEGVRTPPESGLAPPLQGAAYPWLADPIPYLPSAPAPQESDEMPSPLRRTTSPLSLRAIARRPSLVFSSERRREGSIGGSSNASNDSLPRQPSRAHTTRNPSPLAEGSATLLRAPSFLRRGSSPDFPPRRGSDASLGRASPAVQQTPAGRASPGLHAYPRTASPLSMQPEAPPPGPPAVYADDMARSSSPMGMSELSAPLVTPRLAHRVAVRVAPATECINMFGPLQVTSHYSLSGTVTLELSPSEDALELQALDVHLVGYSMYVDSSARFSSVRLCDIKHEVITAPMQLPATHGSDPLQFEVEFDLFAPGWLPASFAARSASTFYNLEAVATVAEPGGRKAPASPQSDYASASTSPAVGTYTAAPPGVGAHATLSPLASEPPAPCTVRSAPHLVRVCRTRDMVPIPVAQLAVFTGADVQEEEAAPNPFAGSTNPFRHQSRNPFLAPRTAPQSSAAQDAQSATRKRLTNRVPLRHFTHAPKIPLPVPVVIQGAVHEYLPLKLTLSVPAHTNTHVESDEEQPPLVFGLQVELDPLWAQTKMWNDLRLCELEAMCVQMEKYSSSLSRSYCTAFALPLEGDVNAADVPAFDPATCAKHAPPQAQHSGVSQYPYNRALLEGRIRQQRAGSAPTDRRNHAERFRSYTVGPLPQSDRSRAKQREATAPAPSASTPASAPSPAAAQSKKKKALTSPFSRFSVFQGARDEEARPAAEALVLPPPAPAPAQENPKASYVFDGSDGCGIALAPKKVRLSFSLPMVPSSGKTAMRGGTTQLLPDYESPHVRIRHKLKVKLRFGYGSSQLATNAGTQSLVMCVPVRFTEAPPGEALAQAAPIVFPPSAERCVPAEGAPNVAVPAALTRATHSSFAATPAHHPAYLPAYVQLFREDGSRLADDTELLPRYPEPGSLLPMRTRDDDAFSERLDAGLVLVPDAVREDKSAAPTSMVETLNAADDLFPEDVNEVAPQRVDDDMLDADMQQTTVVTNSSALDYDLLAETQEMQGARSPNVFSTSDP